MMVFDSMKNKLGLKICLLVDLIGIVMLLFLRREVSLSGGDQNFLIEKSAPLKAQNEVHSYRLNATGQAEETPKPTSQEPGSFLLTPGNFEGFVHRCFAGEICTLDGDPWKLYQSFKVAGKHLAIDNLISFLRSKMGEADFRSIHKDALKRMIIDFYPLEERQFQEGAYYYYTGNLQKSLDLYLDLEKKTRLNPKLSPAPKLNIANVFYDLERFEEALPYYEAALKEEFARDRHSEAITFIEGRILAIKSNHFWTYDRAFLAVDMSVTAFEGRWGHLRLRIWNRNFKF